VESVTDDTHLTLGFPPAAGGWTGAYNYTQPGATIFTGQNGFHFGITTDRNCALNIWGSTNSANPGTGALLRLISGNTLSQGWGWSMDSSGNLFLNERSGNGTYYSVPKLVAANATVSTMAKFDGSKALVSASAGTDYQAPTVMTSNTTATITFNTLGNPETIYNTSSSTIVTATITLPATSAAGQLLTYVSNGAITTLTITGGTEDVGGTLPATLAANTTLQFQETGTGGHYVRIK
jgi:hypothetical protein